MKANKNKSIEDNLEWFLPVKHNASIDNHQEHIV